MLKYILLILLMMMYLPVYKNSNRVKIKAVKLDD